MKEEMDWVKVNLMCGVVTNVITAVEVCESEGADSPFMPGLVATTAEHFTVREVSADKGYSSVDNHGAWKLSGTTLRPTWTASSHGGWVR